MRIGIASNTDIKTFIKFFPNEEKLILENCFDNAAPAVNTLILSFLEKGIFVRLFTLSKKRSFSLKSEKFELYAIKACDSFPVRYLWVDFINMTRVKKCLEGKTSDLEVLHAHWTYTYALASASFSKRIPVFCTVRDWTPYIWKIEALKNKLIWSFRYILNELVFRNKTLYFISNSSYTYDLIERKYGIKTPIIPNPIKESFLTELPTRESDKFSLVCVSSTNDKRKNIKTLLYAFRLLHNKYINSELILIGTPFSLEYPQVRKWENEGLLDGVVLKGAVGHEDLKYYLDRASIFVSPSLEETFGNTFIEAMARKIPVIGGIHSGAVPSVLDNGRSGFLCDVSNAKSLAEKIEAVYLNKNDRIQVVEFAYKMIKDKYISSKICDLHLDLYRRKIGENYQK